MSGNKVFIVGGPGCGKSTLAHREAKRLGVPIVLCTDTPEQARATGRAIEQGTLYAPSSLGKDWSGLSRWVADTWLDLPGPRVIEGVALVRALNKWHESNPGLPPPCDVVLWCRDPHIELSHGAAAMLTGHDTKLETLLDEWDELYAIIDSVV